MLENPPVSQLQDSVLPSLPKKFHLQAQQVLAKDRHWLLQLWRAKDAVKFHELLEYSSQAVLTRAARFPAITLNPDLPVSQAAAELRSALETHQVIIVAGETGSGKTTQLPKIAMLAGRGTTGLIGHTQPRRLAARSVAQRIAEELGEPLGKSVAFKVRFNESGSQDSIIRLMTDGILLAELAHDRFLTKYDTLIIDEAHERSLNIDFIMGYVRQILPKRPDLKVIITSATLDVERFSQYFNDAPIFSVEGRSFPVEVRYRPIADLPVQGSDDDAFDQFEEDLPRAVLAAVEECYQDARLKGTSSQADILIFASTEQEIHELQETLEQYGPPHTEILPLYARLALADQQKIFSPGKGGRRIIIATNVAETALTVPNIHYVIDSGFARISRYSYRSRVQRLPIEAISQAAANQRKGRCGRVAAGVCIRLYSEEDFLGRPEFTEPEIRRTNLASVILQMENLGLGTVDTFEFIDPPDYRLVNDGKKLLLELGALTEHKTGLTRIGQMMARMPIDPRLSRMLLGGAHFGVLAETLIIVSALAVQDPRERPADKKTQADQKHALFKEPNSDFLFYVKLWQTLEEQRQKPQQGGLTERQRRQFARQHFLSWLRLREWRQTYLQLLETLKELKLNFNEQPATYENLHRALLTGLLSFVAHKTDEKNEYLAVRQQKARLFPASVLHKQGVAWIMGFEMVETSHVFMRTLAKIEPEWIIAAAKDLLKYHYFEPHWSKKSGHVKAYAQISLYGLIILPKQLVQYEKINLPEAHEIFLRDALVTQALGIEPPFMQHNQHMIEHVQRVEDKVRRRDLLVDEEALYQFYAERVPPQIASRRSFEDWRAEAERKQPDLLCLTEQDILAGHMPSTQDFPDVLQVGHLNIPVQYHFNPSSELDGAILNVPLPALSQLEAQRLAWGVAGWRAALLESLLKSLPKELRRKVVPIPNQVARLLPLLNADLDMPLTEQIAHQLLRLGIDGISAQDFDFNQLPDYLRPLVQVVDAKKNIIAKSRDIDELQARCQHYTQQSHSKTQGEISLIFPPQFTFEQAKQMAGLTVYEYQALVPVKGNAKAERLRLGVQIQRFHDLNAAQLAHRQGILQLYGLQLGDAIKALRKQVPKALILTFAPLGDSHDLEHMLIHATLDATFTETPLNAQDFEAQLQAQRGQFLVTAQQILAELTAIFTQWQQVRRLLMGLELDVFAENIHDIEDQLDALHLNDFVYRMDVAHWRQYPRYLKALLQRLERLPNNLTRDTEGVRVLDPHIERLSGHEDDPRFAEYRWMLEELRISLFAQPMKTLYPVSTARLDKLWQAATRKH